MKTENIYSLFRAALTSVSVLLTLGACTKSEIDSQAEAKDHFIVTPTIATEIPFAKNSTNKFAIDANITWDAEVTEGDEWCHLSGYSSAEIGLKAEIFITVDANISTEPRTATIEITANGADAPEVLTVKQIGYGPAIIISERLVTTLGVKGSTATFTVMSTSAWSIEENDYYSFEPSHGAGDPYLTEEPTTITATAKSTNSTDGDITTSVMISNQDGKESELELIQQTAVTLDFEDSSPLTASADGQTLKIKVLTDSEAWKMYCSNSTAKIDYSKFDSEGVVLLTLGKNTTFADRTMTLSLKSDDGFIVGDNEITVTQPSKNGAFDMVSYMGASKATIDPQTGALTIDHTAGLKARIMSKDNSIYGMGTYTIGVDNYVGVSNSYINIQAENKDVDRVNVAIGPCTTTSVIRNGAGSIFANPAAKPTLENMQSMTKMIFSLLPSTDDESKMTMAVELRNDEDVLYEYSLQMDNYYSKDPDFVNDFALYFGLCADSAPTGTNTMTINSFEFEPYTPGSTEEPDGGNDKEEITLDFNELNYTSYLNGTHSISEAGALTITHESTMQSRFTTEDKDGMAQFGMGEYTIKFSNFTGSGNSFINLQAVSTSAASGEQFNINIGPAANQSVLKSNLGLWTAAKIQPTLAQLEGMTTLTISLLPVETNPVNMKMTVSIDGTEVGSIAGIKSFITSNADYANDMNIYFGVGSVSAKGGSAITIDSFTYKPFEN